MTALVFVIPMSRPVTRFARTGISSALLRAREAYDDLLRESEVDFDRRSVGIASQRVVQDDEGLSEPLR
jgi:hypothetical protein